MMEYLTEAHMREAGYRLLERTTCQWKHLSGLPLESIEFQAGKVIMLSPVPLNSTQLREFSWGHAPQKPEDALHTLI